MVSQLMRIEVPFQQDKEFVYHVMEGFLKTLTLIPHLSTSSDAGYWKIKFLELASRNHPNFLINLKLDSDLEIHNDELYLQGKRIMVLQINFQFERGDMIKFSIYHHNPSNQNLSLVWDWA